jgi:anhydro-N-acetylmuramic acid kinase
VTRAERKPAPSAVPADAWRGLRGYRERTEHWVAGLMTGTSADAVDAALVEFSGQGLNSKWRLVAYRETPLPAELRDEILMVAGADRLAPERLMRLDAALGESYAAAVLELCAAAGMTPDRLDAVGCHGQTVRHVPRDRGGGQAFTLQLGSAAVLAERTGAMVVSNFRARDAAAGGEGAPLVPLADWWLFRSADEARGLLNLGGIANLTVLPRSAAEEDYPDRLLAFDTGPGNMVLDEMVALLTGGRERRDQEGARAARGTVSRPLLDELLADPFFELVPPRSTGREHFGQAYAERLVQIAGSMGLREADILATAVELTAAAVGRAVERFVAPLLRLDALYISGGGARNPTLVRALERQLDPMPVRPISALGVEPDAKEALAFAFLGHQTLCGLPGNVPSATGAARRVVLGQVTPGRAR